MGDEVSFSTKYSLMTSNNHSSTLDQGHYWAVVKDLNSRDWLSCNDKVVRAVSQHSLKTQLHTSFLQEKLNIVNFVQEGFVFLNIVFGCDDPTYYPSPGSGI